MQQRPHSRIHQERIGSLRKEIRCILQVLEEQSEVMHQFRGVIETNDALNWRQSHVDHLLAQCHSAVDDRVSNFKNLDLYARDLAAFVSFLSLSPTLCDCSKARFC